MKLLTAFSLAFCLLFTGCVAQQGIILTPKIDDKATYAIGQEITVGTGSVMLSRTHGGFYDRYVATKTVPAYGDTPIQEGTLWEAMYEFDGYQVLTSESYFNRGIGVLIDFVGNPLTGRSLISSAVLNPNPMGRPLAGTYTFHFIGSEPGLFKKMETGMPAKGAKREELIYSGISGQTLAINYREYIDDFARPSFYQEAKYDLAAGKEITFKNIKIRVVKANNNGITFIPLE